MLFFACKKRAEKEKFRELSFFGQLEKEAQRELSGPPPCLQGVVGYTAFQMARR
jgi:hypothetical protein